jgi:hypothetical protein
MTLANLARLAAVGFTRWLARRRQDWRGRGSKERYAQLIGEQHDKDPLAETFIPIAFETILFKPLTKASLPNSVGPRRCHK